MVQIFVGAGDGVSCDHFAVIGGSFLASFDCGVDGGHVASDQDRYVGGSDLFFADKLNVGGFEHGVAGNETCCEALCFKDAKCV